jgi:tetratricopeptide (TPR) repeat protein
MDVNAAFSSAEKAYQNKDFFSALRKLEMVHAAVGDNPVVLHLTGLCQKGSGQIVAAIASLEKAAKLAPADSQIANNLGNCLLQADRKTDALAQYSLALSLRPGFTDARLNRAICLHALSQFEDARVEFRHLQNSNPGDVRFWTAAGAMELDAHNYGEARQAFAKALEIQPDNIKGKSGLAKAALELGDSCAATLYEDALLVEPRDKALVIGHAYAKQFVGDDDAAERLIPMIAATPDWIEGQRTLAAILWESGDYETYAATFEQSVIRSPRNDDMRIALARLFSDSLDIEKAYLVLQDRPNNMHPIHEIDLMRANLASELMREREAEEHFAELPAGNVDVQIYRAKHELRFQRPDKAEMLLTPICEKYPRNITAWAFLDFCWRLNGDDRHRWLHGQEGFYGLSRLELDESDIAEIGDYLRGLHISKAQPLGQSLRGGTQTKGFLLERPGPVIGKLRGAIETAVANHWNGLPSVDPAHPLLMHREKCPAILGSWSVRLTEQGFHVQHIHPQGLLSSACYLVLPNIGENSESPDGWLELGGTPPDFSWALDPVARIRPEPGHIALFPSSLFHGTVPFSAGERISVAFDVVTAV